MQSPMPHKYHSTTTSGESPPVAGVRDDVAAHGAVGPAAWADTYAALDPDPWFFGMCGCGQFVTMQQGIPAGGVCEHCQAAFPHV